MSKIVRHDIDLENPPPLTDEQKARLKLLRDMPDDQIDTSDIPEITDWSGFKRGRFYKPVKKLVSLRIDADVVEWFKRRAPAGGYQTDINRALREHIERLNR